MIKIISPNKNSPRNHKIDRITPHCIVGLWSSTQACQYFNNPNIKASANYCIGKDGDVGVCVEEGDWAWISSSSSNDNRAITIECASDTKSPYQFPIATYNSLIELCVDIMRRYNKTKLVYIENGIDYEPKEEEMQLTLHRWFKKKACPGEWFISMIPDFIFQVNSKLNGGDMENIEFIEKMSILIKKYYTTFNFCNVSVPLAQAILESGWGRSELAVNASNYFGLKHRDRRCPSACGTYIKEGSEQNPDGSYSSSVMTWEKFPNMEASVKGYYEFLTNAGGRYDNLKGVVSPDVYVRLIKDDGYCTSQDYVNKILDIINKYDLRKYDDIKENVISKSDLLKLKQEILNLFSKYGV